MHATIHGERTLTDLDFTRLSKLLGRELPPTLADLLASAEVTSSRAVPPDVVTMYSRVELVKRSPSAIQEMPSQRWASLRCSRQSATACWV
jgi:hypothetical protein